MSYIRFSFETSYGRGEEATLEILQSHILIGGEYKVELVDYGGAYGPGESDPFRIVSSSSLFDIEDDRIVEILTEMAIRTKAKLWMLITNKDKSKHRFIVAGTKKLVADKFYVGDFDPEKLKKAGHKPDRLLSCIHKWDDLSGVNIYHVD